MSQTPARSSVNPSTDTIAPPANTGEWTAYSLMFCSVFQVLISFLLGMTLGAVSGGGGNDIATAGQALPQGAAPTVAHGVNGECIYA